jgi:hypothetical protein
MRLRWSGALANGGGKGGRIEGQPSQQAPELRAGRWVMAPKQQRLRGEVMREWTVYMMKDGRHLKCWGVGTQDEAAAARTEMLRCKVEGSGWSLSVGRIAGSDDIA